MTGLLVLGFILSSTFTYPEHGEETLTPCSGRVSHKETVLHCVSQGAERVKETSYFP